MITLACGRVPVDVSSGATASLRSDDVRASGFTSDGLGWTLSNGTLEVSSDVGNTWRSIGLPLGFQAWKSAAVVSDQVALVATRNAKGAIVGLTTSAGGSWTVSPLLTSIGDISDDIGVAYEGTTGVAMVRFQTSSNFAAGEIFSTVDGVGWSRHKAPTAGTIALTDRGTLWLAGGPINDQLWQSRDLGSTWSRVSLPALNAEYAVDIPHPIGNGVLILPITVMNPAGTADVLFLRSTDDGVSWKSMARVRTSAGIGPGVRLPSAVVGDRLYVVDTQPSGARTYVAGPSGVFQQFASSGLPNGVGSIAFNARGNGWATVSNVQCASDKRTCSSLQAIFRTLDGGLSWQRLALGHN
jgi:hypothetical protein